MVELIPVIEMPLLQAPLKQPEGSFYWEEPEPWSAYFSEKAKLLGFSAQLRFYNQSMPWILLEDLSLKDLELIVDKKVLNKSPEEIIPLE
ncbi:MAG: hypothetical protein R3345_02605, partial [Fulvivirga sp.]|nr:hypothetical protein [Fulvivirga sp.]